MLELNHNPSTLIHIDINSAFASIEQQNNPLWRGHPLVVAAYTTPSGCVLASSVEAKKLGIKTGMQVRDARLICPQVIVTESHPEKYRLIHQKMMWLFRHYTPNAFPKSIDEAALDFSHVPVAINRGLKNIALEIKERIKKEVGDWLTVSIGIGPNRFLAKTAAGLHKPDGLDEITYENLRAVLSSLNLKDLHGINVQYETRLKMAGIYTPLDFLNAPLPLLRQVFQSVSAYYWYLRLRGFEIDAVNFGRKSFGNSYALPGPTEDPRFLSQILCKLCEKTGARIREAGFTAQGITLYCLFKDHTHFHHQEKLLKPIFTSSEIFRHAQRLLNQAPIKPVVNLAISVFNLQKTSTQQLDLFDLEASRSRRIRLRESFPRSVEDDKRLSSAIDRINGKYGAFMITPAFLLNTKKYVLDRIAFGGVKELKDLPFEERVKYERDECNF